MKRSLTLYLLALTICASEGAIELTSPSNNHSSQGTLTTSNVPYYAPIDIQPMSYQDRQELKRTISEWFNNPLPEGYTHPSLSISIEQGWYNMIIQNHTTPSETSNKSYEVDYKINPFMMTKISGMGRIDKFGISSSYSSDPNNKKIGELFSLSMILLDSNDGGWWQTDFSYARLNGTATTHNSANTEIQKDIDSHWNTISFERRYYPMFVCGLQYESIDMPSNYSLNNPDGQVLAIFDSKTNWHTISVVLGIDSSNASVIERQTDLIRPLYEMKIGLGVGYMDYDKAGAKSIAERYGYTFDGNDQMIYQASSELALGVQSIIAYKGIATDISIGARLRSEWLGTKNSASNSDNQDYNTLYMKSEIINTSYGVFARLGMSF